jgi:glucose-6-phosphate-specific signal transduction histidine kinase
MRPNRAASIAQDLLLYAVSAAISGLIIFVGLRHLDPNRDHEKNAARRKKEIAKRLGRPLVRTNAYEVSSVP